MLHKLPFELIIQICEYNDDYTILKMPLVNKSLRDTMKHTHIPYPITIQKRNMDTMAYMGRRFKSIDSIAFRPKTDSECKNCLEIACTDMLVNKIRILTINLNLDESSIPLFYYTIKKEPFFTKVIKKNSIILTRLN